MSLWALPKGSPTDLQPRKGQDMRILVTGGAGYIGSHTVRHLQEHGHSVSVYDNLSRGHSASVPADIFTQGDLHDFNKLDHVMVTNQIEAVIHFAAFAQVGESTKNPELYYRNNVAGTISLIDAMKRCNITKLVFSSTCATYGNPTVVPIVEETPQKPINPYGKTKLMVEWMLKDLCTSHKWSCASLRYFNAAGASPKGDIGEDHNPETHLIPLALNAAVGRSKALEIFGNDYPTPDGTCIRDYIHVDDLASAHRLALEKTLPAEHLCLNLGTAKGNSVHEILNAVKDITGKPVPFTIGARREGDPPALVASCKKANLRLGWEASYKDIRDIIATAWRWHESHPDGYKTR